MKSALCPSLILIAATAAIPAGASTVTKCPSGQYLAYYVLILEPVSVVNEVHAHSYVDPAGQEKSFQEFGPAGNEPPPLYQVCSINIPLFEAEHGIATGNPISFHGRDRELFEVVNLAGGPAGTVWRDRFAPFDQGGSIGGQSYWDCDAVPVIDNFAGFSSGLDGAGINGVTATNAELHYFSPIRERLVQIDRNWMIAEEECSPYATKEAFFQAPNLSQTEVWYRNYDPTLGYAEIP